MDQAVILVGGLGTRLGLLSAATHQPRLPWAVRHSSTSCCARRCVTVSEPCCYWPGIRPGWFATMPATTNSPDASGSNSRWS